MAEEKKNSETQKEPSLPANYVTIAQLKERWLAKEEKKKKEKEERERRLKQLEIDLQKPNQVVKFESVEAKECERGEVTSENCGIEGEKVVEANVEAEEVVEVKEEEAEGIRSAVVEAEKCVPEAVFMEKSKCEIGENEKVLTENVELIEQEVEDEAVLVDDFDRKSKCEIDEEEKVQKKNVDFVELEVNNESKRDGKWKGKEKCDGEIVQRENVEVVNRPALRGKWPKEKCGEGNNEKVQGENGVAVDWLGFRGKWKGKEKCGDDNVQGENEDAINRPAFRRNRKWGKHRTNGVVIEVENGEARADVVDENEQDNAEMFKKKKKRNKRRNPRANGNYSVGSNGVAPIDAKAKPVEEENIVENFCDKDPIQAEEASVEAEGKVVENEESRNRFRRNAGGRGYKNQHRQQKDSGDLTVSLEENGQVCRQQKDVGKEASSLGHRIKNVSLHGSNSRHGMGFGRSYPERQRQRESNMVWVKKGEATSADNA